MDDEEAAAVSEMSFLRLSAQEVLVDLLTMIAIVEMVTYLGNGMAGRTEIESPVKRVGLGRKVSGIAAVEVEGIQSVGELGNPMHVA